MPDGKRTVPEIKKMIADISTRQVDNFDQLCAALRHAVANPHERAAERKEANRVMHHRLDGKAGVRAAECILETLGE